MKDIANLRSVALTYLIMCLMKYCIKQKQHGFQIKIFYIDIGNADARALQMTGVF